MTGKPELILGFALMRCRPRSFLSRQIVDVWMKTLAPVAARRGRSARATRILFLSGDHKLRRPQQGALDLCVRKGTNRPARGFGIVRGLSGGGFQRSVTLQDFQNLRMS